MLQAILERIVLKYFGEYLMDFNQKNISLAIWNGSLKIQGLKFKPCILSELNLPIKLQYSWIGTLEILVPWSKLSAHPVEIRIMDIFIIVSPVKRNFWQTKFDNAYIKMEFIQDLMKKLLIKQKEKNPNISSKSGYFDLIIAKIIDNIQLKIENIHIRFENDIMDYPFTLGITLKQLTIETKDKTWSKMNFYDRTNPKNKNIPINKHLILRNFEVYLNSNDKLFFGKSETSSIINEKMNLFEKNMDYDISTSEKKTHLLRINDYLLNVSFDLKLTINFDHNYYSLPEYLGEMNVENMNLNLKNTQIQDVINLLEFFNEYEFFMSSYKKKIHYSLSEKPILINLKSLSAKNKSKLLQNLWIYWGELVIFELRKINFIRLMTQYLASNPKSTNFKLTKLQKSNSKILRDICQRTSIEYLKKWTQLAVDRFISTIPNYLSKFPFVSFLSGSSLNKDSNPLITFDEILEIKKYFDNQNFYGSDKNKLKKAGGTPDSYISAFFSFKLHKGKIKFTKFVKGKAEGLILKWFDLTLDIKISLNSNVFEGSIGEFVVEHFNKISQNYSENKILLLNSDQKKTKPFLHMLFEKKFEDNFEMSQKLRLFLEMNAIQFRFFPLIIKRILSYLVFQTIDENLKEKAYKQVKNLQKLTQKSLENLVKDPQKIEIYAIIYSPIIIIPINQTTDSKSPCIIIHLGDIKLVSDENTPINTIDFEEKTPINLSKIPTHSYYDVFILTLTSFKIVYLNNLEELESKFSDDSKIHKKLKKNTPSKFYQESRTKKIFRSIKIIKKMQVKINIQILKEQLYLYTEKPRISLNIQIEKIIFGLHPFILTKIKQLEKTFTESVENSEDLLLFEKKHLLENAIKIGIMNRFDKNRDVIERRFIILSDMYLYFFDGPDKPIYESYYYLREANIEYGNSLITIMNKNKEKIVLFSEDPENFEEWADILNKVIEKSNVSNKVFNIAKKSSSFEQNNIAQVKINLAIKEVKLNLYDADHILWLAFCFDGLEVKMNKKPIDFDCLIEVCKFHVLSLDNIPNSHPDLKYLISNCPFSFLNSANIENTIEILKHKITIEVVDTKNSHTSNTILNFTISSLFINWKPELIAKLLEFLMKNLTDKNDNNAFTFPLETLLSDRNPFENNSSRKSFKQLSTLRKNYKKLKSSTSIDIQKDFETSPQPKELNENFTKTQINFQIQTISIIMVTPFNLSIGKLIGENLKIGLFFKKSSINVDGELEQMRLMDVSGYPLTLCGYLKNQSENDFELLSSKSKRILTFNFQFIDDDCCIEDKIYNYINFSFDGLILNYLQQPVLRIFDYLNEKVLGVLTYDYKTEEKLKSDPRRLRQIIKDPRFTDLNFKFTNLEVNILIMPLLQERMKIFIKDVIIGNSSSKDYERIPKIVIDKRFQDYIFIDTITMNLNSLNIYKQEEGFNDLKKISTEFNIEINIKRIINSEDVHCFFSSIVEIDDSIKINISINNFKLQLQKPDYCHIMKLVYNNLIYDDGLDKFIYFGPDSKDISLLPRTCREIQLTMNLNQIAFSLCESTTLWNLSSFNNFLPTIDINFNRAQIKYCRCRNYSKKIEITSENLFGVSYIYSHCIEKESKVLIQGFANNLNKRKELYISTFLKQKNEDSFNFSFKETDSTAKTKSNIDFQEESMFNKSSGLDNSDKFSMQMEISYEGAKKIEITLQNFDFLLNLNLFFRIIGFFNFDNFVSVVTPNG